MGNRGIGRKGLFLLDLVGVNIYNLKTLAHGK